MISHLDLVNRHDKAKEKIDQIFNLIGDDIVDQEDEIYKQFSNLVKLIFSPVRQI